MFKGIDISHYNKITDWNKIKADFIIQKCTEGVGYKDSTYDKNKIEIRKKCIFGAYHFARGGDVIKEAEWFLKNLGEIQEDDILVLDWEIQHPNPVGWCKDFLEIVKFKTGLTPYLYINDSTAKKYAWFKDYPFWIARYGVNNGTPSREPDFKDWTIWQYSSRGRVEGISGYVDLNEAKTILATSGELTEPSTNGFTKFSQNDPRWKEDFIGGSNLKVKNYGCTGDVVCTQASWFGDTITPKELFRHKEIFTLGGLIIWKMLETIFKKIKFKYRYYSFNETVFDEALDNPNTAIVANVNRGYHWVAVLKKVKGGYLCSDPYPYPAKNRVYTFDDICGFTILQKK